MGIIVFVGAGFMMLIEDGNILGLIMIIAPFAIIGGIWNSAKKDEQEKAEIEARVREKLKSEKEEYNKNNTASKSKRSAYTSSYSKRSGTSGTMDPIEYQMINDVSDMVSGDSWDDDDFF